MKYVQTFVDLVHELLDSAAPEDAEGGPQGPGSAPTGVANHTGSQTAHGSEPTGAGKKRKAGALFDSDEEEDAENAMDADKAQARSQPARTFNRCGFTKVPIPDSQFGQGFEFMAAKRRGLGLMAPADSNLLGQIVGLLTDIIVKQEMIEKVEKRSRQARSKRPSAAVALEKHSKSEGSEPTDKADDPWPAIQWSSSTFISRTIHDLIVPARQSPSAFICCPIHDVIALACQPSSALCVSLM